MGKFITKCCVCGNIKSIVSDNSFEGERISHGYCNKECAHANEVQLMLWDMVKGCWTLDIGYEVAGNLYHQGKAVAKHIDLEVGVALDEAKKASKLLNIPIVM